MVVEPAEEVPSLCVNLFVRSSDGTNEGTEPTTCFIFGSTGWGTEFSGAFHATFATFSHPSELAFHFHARGGGNRSAPREVSGPKPRVGSRRRKRWGFEVVFALDRSGQTDGGSEHVLYTLDRAESVR